jgi:hypothetical protein
LPGGGRRSAAGAESDRRTVYVSLADVDGNGTLDLVSPNGGVTVTQNESGRCVVPYLVGKTLARARAL